MLGKILRIIAIILMGLTSAMMFLGGIGTICIAFWPEKYESLAVMVPYKPIYQVAAILTILAGILGVWVTIKLRHLDKRTFLYTVLILLLSLATAGVKMYFSNKVRGSVAPTNIRFYLTLITLAYFLVMRIPSIWEKVQSGPRLDDDADAGAGIAAIIAGALTLTVQFWAGPTHTFGGVNYADVWHVQLAIVGWALILIGLIPLVRAVTASSLPQRESQVALAADV